MGEVTLTHLILDFNGTIAVDGRLATGVRERLEELSRHLDIHIITADTYGSAHDTGLDIPLHIIPKGEQDRAKLEFVQGLGSEGCVAIGNGANDALMLREAKLGFAIVQAEGCATTTMMASDVLFTDINDALDTLLSPKRLIATLRK